MAALAPRRRSRRVGERSPPRVFILRESAGSSLLGAFAKLGPAVEPQDDEEISRPLRTTMSMRTSR
jgi:hypothetical protein